jgi:NADH-quinone oxidoreductase subunit D
VAATLHNFFTASPLSLETSTGEVNTSPGTLVSLRSPQDKELATEDLTLSLGPAHPAIYGPLRLVLTLDGEQVAVAEADPGYAHRGLEKRAEGQEPATALAIGAELDALAPLAGTVAVTLALEKMWLSEEEQLPRRAGFLRLIVLELERIASHLFAHSILLKTLALDGTANKLLDLYTEVIGTLRLVAGDTASFLFVVPGGVQNDLNVSSISVLSSLVHRIQNWVRQEIGPPAYSLRNRLFHYTLKSRVEGQGPVGFKEAVELGFTGPNLRASGHSFDGRSLHSLAETGLPYRELNFKPVFSRRSQAEGDAYSRFRQRLDEIAASSGLVEQALKNLPAGPIRLPLDLDQSFMAKRLREGNFGSGEAGGMVESPRGLLEARLALTLGSDGKVIIERLHFRSPSWPHFAAVSDLITGTRLPDALVIINSLDIAPDEAER